MSIRVRMLVLVSTLLIASGVQAQQAGASKQAARPAPAVEGPPPSEAAINQMMKAGRSIEAARLLEEHARRAPGNKSLKVRAAQVYESQGDLTAAKEAARQAAAGDAPSPDALAVLGRIAAREGDWSNAVALWRRVVGASPNNAAAHLDYANALDHVGDAAGANSEYAIYRSLAGMTPIPNAAAKK
jgi:Flp pilus assembly protein TadD